MFADLFCADVSTFVQAGDRALQDYMYKIRWMF